MDTGFAAYPDGTFGKWHYYYQGISVCKKHKLPEGYKVTTDNIDESKVCDDCKKKVPQKIKEY